MYRPYELKGHETLDFGEELAKRADINRRWLGLCESQIGFWRIQIIHAIYLGDSGLKQPKLPRDADFHDCIRLCVSLGLSDNHEHPAEDVRTKDALQYELMYPRLDDTFARGSLNRQVDLWLLGAKHRERNGVS